MWYKNTEPEEGNVREVGKEGGWLCEKNSLLSLSSNEGEGTSLTRKGEEVRITGRGRLPKGEGLNSPLEI